MESNLLVCIKSIYEGYLADTIRLEKNRSLSDGLMGFGKRLDFDACHDAFAEQIEKCIREGAAKSPSSTEVFELLDFMFKVPQENRSNKLAYWMLLAIQKHGEVLFPFLKLEEAEKLFKLYSEIYPRNTMLPVQKEIIKALQTQSGKDLGLKKNILSGFFNSKGTK